MADRHDIGVKWAHCDIANCTHKCKHRSDLMRHMRKRHNAEYNARMKKQEERVRLALVASGLQQYYFSDSMPPIGFFKREKYIDFKCADIQSDKGFAKIDFVIALQGGGYVFLEVDEKQHKRGYDASISCDMKRMSHVMESIATEMMKTTGTGGGDLEIPPIYWLRYNPDAWYVNDDRQYVPKVTREARLVKWLADFRAETDMKGAKMRVGYAYYDSDENGELHVLQNDAYSPVIREVVDNLCDGMQVTVQSDDEQTQCIVETQKEKEATG